MAGVEADAHAVLQIRLHEVQDGPQFFEGPTDFTALARHGFQQNGRRLARVHEAVQRVRDPRDGGLCALPHMAAGVEVHVLSRKVVFEVLQIATKDIFSVLHHVLLHGAQVHRVRCVGDDGAEAVLLYDGPQCRGVLRHDRFGGTASGASQEERERIASEGEGGLPHGFPALCHGHVGSDVDHGWSPYFRLTMVTPSSPSP